MARCLIVNADDFGLSAGVNRGIIECVERGILTSASLMVRWEAASEAAAYARRNRAFSLGLHLDLGEWVLREGQWEPLYTVISTNSAREVAEEIQRQLAAFRRLVGRNPSHLDSHQHVHRQPPAKTVAARLARELGIPLREADPRIRYCGDFYGQGAEGESLPGVLTLKNLEMILKHLGAGITELGCHPGYDDGLATPYRAERAEEIRVLCDPALRAVLKREHITLCSFNEAWCELHA